MNKRLPSLLCFGLVAVLGLTGCKNDSDDRAYNTVGESRVFDDEERASTQKSRAYFQENVPAPQPIVDAPAVRSQPSAPRTFVEVAPVRRIDVAARSVQPRSSVRQFNKIGERDVFE